MLIDSCNLGNFSSLLEVAVALSFAFASMTSLRNMFVDRAINRIEAKYNQHIEDVNKFKTKDILTYSMLNYEMYDNMTDDKYEDMKKKFSDKMHKFREDIQEDTKSFLINRYNNYKPIVFTMGCYFAILLFICFGILYLFFKLLCYKDVFNAKYSFVVPPFILSILPFVLYFNLNSYSIFLDDIFTITIFLNFIFLIILFIVLPIIILRIGSKYKIDEYELESNKIWHKYPELKYLKNNINAFDSIKDRL